MTSCIQQRATAASMEARRVLKEISRMPWEENCNPKLETRGVYLGTVTTLHRAGITVSALNAALKQVGVDLERGASDPAYVYATQHRKRSLNFRPYYVWGIDGDIEPDR